MGFRSDIAIFLLRNRTRMLAVPVNPTGHGVNVRRGRREL